jgi:opacity protein-like surface antigen
MRNRRTIATISSSVLVGAALAVAPAGAAQAANCSSGRDWTYRYAAYSVCYQTAHRAYMVCKTSPNNSVNTYVGPWVGSGQRSTAFCPHATLQVLYYGSDLPD